MDWINKMESQDICFFELINGDSKYKNGKLKPEQLMQLSGCPYYTSHCFIMERLVNIYFKNYI